VEYGVHPRVLGEAVAEVEVETVEQVEEVVHTRQLREDGGLELHPVAVRLAVLLDLLRKPRLALFRLVRLEQHVGGLVQLRLALAGDRVLAALAAERVLVGEVAEIALHALLVDHRQHLEQVRAY
jgi:hypothetical protein